jgi:thiazole synthase ThiGH ThiG subunit
VSRGASFSEASRRAWDGAGTASKTTVMVGFGCSCVLQTTALPATSYTARSFRNGLSAGDFVRMSGPTSSISHHKPDGPSTSARLYSP